VTGNPLRRFFPVHETPQESTFFHRESLLERAPSKLQGARFHVTVTAYWHLAHGNSDDRLWQARAALQTKIRERAVLREIEDASILESDLQSLLMACELADGVRLARVSVQVEVPQTTLDFAEAHRRLVQDSILTRLRQDQELEQLRHLRTAILGDPGFARAYWLQNRPGPIDPLLSEAFDQLAERINGRPSEENSIETSWAAQLGHALTGFLGSLNEAERQTLVRWLSQLFSNFGQAHINQRLPVTDAPSMAATNGYQHDLPF
jgi:hypothetical protein